MRPTAAAALHHAWVESFAKLSFEVPEELQLAADGTSKKESALAAAVISTRRPAEKALLACGERMIVLVVVFL